MDFRKYAEDTVSRVALMVTAEEQHALHELAQAGHFVEGAVAELKPFDFAEEIEKAVAARFESLKAELVDAVIAALHLPDPIKAEQEAQPAAPPEAKQPEMLLHNTTEATA